MAKLWFKYSLLALTIMGPMLGSGYILTLDMVFTPKLAAPSGVTNNYLWQWLMHLANLAVPSQIIEKLIIFGVLVACGVGMHLLVKSLAAQARGKATKFEPVALYFSGLFYVINPWTYERWMAGHYLILAGYALLPWFYRHLLNALQKPNKKSAIWVAAWFILITIFSLHLAVLAGLLGLITASVYLFRAKRPQQIGAVKYLATAASAIIVISSYWLVGLLNGISQTAKTIAPF